MKKNLLLFAMALLPLFVQGAVGIDNIYYELYSSPSGNTAAVTSHPYKYGGELNIPPTVVYLGVEYKVTSIIDYAICENDQLTSVSIPGSVTTIGESAFYNCRALTTVTLQNGIETIGRDAFYGCTSLTSVTIPGSVNTIGEFAFGLCTQMTSATIEDGVPSISAYAFSECTSLTSVSIPNSVTYIGNQAFSHSGLTSVTIPGSVTDLGAWTFNRCVDLQSVTIEEGVTNISNYTFLECFSLTSVSIPSSVTTIGDGAFLSCTSLPGVTIPANVTSIGDEAFSRCSSLASISIPRNVTSIGRNAFSACLNMTAMNVENGNTVYDSREDCNAIIETATNTLCYACKQTTIPSSVTTIGASAFSELSSMTTVSIPATVKSIAQEAFYLCSGLTDVYCYAEEIPQTHKEAFSGASITTAKLHVPESAVSLYASIKPWSYFGEVVALDDVPKPTGMAETTSQPVSVKTIGGVIFVNGLYDTAEVKVYTADGAFVGAAKAIDHTATISTPLTPGTVAVVVMGKKAMSVVMR